MKKKVSKNFSKISNKELFTLVKVILIEIKNFNYEIISVTKHLNIASFNSNSLVPRDFKLGIGRGTFGEKIV